MIDRSIAKRYARALFGITHLRGDSEAVLELLEAWDVALQESPDCRIVLGHPEIPQHEKEAIIAAIDADEHSGATVSVRQFLSLLVQNNRLSGLDEVIEEYRRMHLEVKQRIVAKLTSAVPLSADTLKNYSFELSRLTGKKVSIENEVDEGVIGGVRLQLGDRVIDETLKTRLGEVHNLMSGNHSS